MHKILIVEDDISQNIILKEALQSNYSDWNILTADSLSSACQYIEDSLLLNEPFTLFLLDVQLSREEGNQDGFLIAERIRKESRYFRTPILFLTAVADKNYTALSNYHCYNYIPKPYTEADILEQIHQMLMTGYLENNSIEIIDTDRILHRIILDDLYAVITHNHKLIFHTTKGNINARKHSLDSILSKLNDNFIYCHRNCIVNKHHIRNYDKVTQSINVGSLCIKVSRSHMEQILELF